MPHELSWGIGLKRRHAATDIDKPSNLPLIREAINLGAIYLIYIKCKFIPYAEEPPTEAEKEIASGNPRQVRRYIKLTRSFNYGL